MNGDLASALLWSFLAALAVLLAVVFGYMYHKDRDKRKLMFVLAFLSASLSYLPMMQTAWENIWIMQGFCHWGPLPLVSAILLAVISSLLNLENFDKPFKAFLSILVASIFMMIVPLPVRPLHFLQVGAIIVILASSYLIITRREISDLMFLLSMVCFISGSIGMTRDLGVEFTVFAHTFAYVFIALMFATSKKGVGGSIASFFALKRKLERTQEELRISEKKLLKVENIFSASPDAITAIDLNGNITECNQATLDLLGYSSKKELIGKNGFAFVAENDRQTAKENLKKLLEQGSVRNVEYAALTKDGRKIFAELSASVIEGSSGNPTGFVAITKDVTERKRMKDELRRYSEHLEELVEERTRELKEAQERLLQSERLATIGEIAAMVGHDLRNPLQGITNSTYYLKKKLSPRMDKKTKEMLEFIEKGVEYSDKIINDLLEYSGEILLELSETTLKSVINEALSLVEIPEDIQISDLTNEQEIEIDVEKIKRVLFNIIKNAIEAMPKGGNLTIESRKTDGNLEIAITDTGTGMPKYVLEKIWTPLFTTKAKGMGFGLAICKRFAEAHGGNISVESTVGKGTTFTVTIPIKHKLEGGEKTWLRQPESLLSTTTKA